MAQLALLCRYDEFCVSLIIRQCSSMHMACLDLEVALTILAHGRSNRTKYRRTNAAFAVYQ